MLYIWIIIWFQVTEHFLSNKRFKNKGNTLGFSVYLPSKTPEIYWKEIKNFFMLIYLSMLMVMSLNDRINLHYFFNYFDICLLKIKYFYWDNIFSCLYIYIYIYIYIYTHTQPAHCLHDGWCHIETKHHARQAMIRETWVQSQVALYQRLLKWYLIPPCLTLSNIKYISRVKWSNPWKGVAPSPTHWCSSNWKGSFLVALNYGR